MSWTPRSGSSHRAEPSFPVHAEAQHLAHVTDRKHIHQCAASTMRRLTHQQVLLRNPLIHVPSLGQPGLVDTISPKKRELLQADRQSMGGFDHSPRLAQICFVQLEKIINACFMEFFTTMK